MKEFKSLSIEIYKYDPTRAGAFIPTPPKLAAKKAIVNVKSEDGKCLLYSCAAKASKDLSTDDRRYRHPNDPRYYHHFIEQYKTTGIDFPTPVNQINKFEKMNNLTINVYITQPEWTFVRPLRFSKREQSNPINLLMIHDSETNQSHYAWIKSLNRLLNSQQKKGYTYCPRCLYGFNKRRHGEHNLKRHLERGECTDDIQVSYPPPHKREIKFERIDAMMMSPLVLYADFESSLKPMEVTKGNAIYKQEHQITGYCLKPVFRYGLGTKLIDQAMDTYTGPDAIQKFFKAVKIYTTMMGELYEEAGKKPIIRLDPRDPHDRKLKREYHEAKTCHICDGEFKCKSQQQYDQFKNDIKEFIDDEDYAHEWTSEEIENIHISFGFDEDFQKGYKVYDHCHWTGMYFSLVIAT